MWSTFLWQNPRKFPDTIKEVDEEEEEAKIRKSSGLVRTGRLFGGLMDDIKRKHPWYDNDIHSFHLVWSLIHFCVHFCVIFKVLVWL